MKRLTMALVVTGFAVLQTGCGLGVCGDANDRLEECGDEPVWEDDCDDKDECIANCILGSSCEDIHTKSSDDYYYACVTGCGG